MTKYEVQENGNIIAWCDRNPKELYVSKGGKMMTQERKAYLFDRMLERLFEDNMSDYEEYAKELRRRDFSKYEILSELIDSCGMTRREAEDIIESAGI